MNPHPYRLRPYHNPANVDQTKVPAGWRFRYADEMTEKAGGDCRAWTDWLQGRFGEFAKWQGRRLEITYIVPVVS